MHILHIEANGGTNTAEYVKNIVSSTSKFTDQVSVVTSSENIYPNSKSLTFFQDYGSVSGGISKMKYYLKGMISLYFYLIRQEQKQIVHYHWPKFSPLDYLFVLLIKRRKNVSVVATVHNNLPHEIRFFDRYFFKNFYQLVDHFIFHSMQNKIDFESLFFQLEDNFHEIPHYSYEVQESDHKPDQTSILFFGSIRHYKGLDILLEALGKVRKELDFSLTVAGNPEIDMAPLKDLSIKNGIKTNWQLGWVDKEDIDRIFADHHIVVLPYRNIDNSGVVNLAMSYGKVVIASEIGGLKYLIKNEENGFLVPAEDVSALSSTIERLLEMDFDETIRIGKNAKNLMQTKYSLGAIAKKTFELYTSC